MSRLLLRRGGLSLRGLTPHEVAGQIFFNMWQSRQSPYSSLDNDDTLYFWDIPSAHLCWELRVRELIKTHYDTHYDVYRVLRQAYGIRPEDLNLAEYVWSRPSSGWLLAFAVDAVAQIDVPVPPSLHVGALGARNGFVTWDRIPAPVRRELEHELPEPGQTAVAVVDPSMDAGRAIEGREPPMQLDRAIPLDVRKRVSERDGGRCQECGSSGSDVELHIDHIYPWSRGGPNTEDNLQLLCRTCNLAKGSKVLDQQPIPLGVATLLEGRSDRARNRDLRALLDGNDIALKTEAALELGLRTPNLEEAVELLRLARTALDSGVSDRATIELAFLVDSNEESERLAQSCLASTNLSVRELSAALLASLRVESDPSMSEELARTAMRSQEPATRALAATALMSLLPDESEELPNLMQAAYEAGPREIRDFAAWWLATRSDTGERFLALIDEAIGSADPFVSSGALLSLAAAYEESGTSETAAKLARDALVRGDPIHASEARVMLDRLSADPDDSIGTAHEP